MPQVQVVDTTERAPEPTGVEQFFSKLGKSYKDANDRVEIGKIIDEYKANREDANAWENLQLGLEKSNVSPTKRLETQKNLNEIQKQIIEKDKSLNAQVKAAKDAADKAKKNQRDQKESEALLIEAGYSPEEAQEQSQILTPQSARTLASQKKPGEKYAELRETSISKYVNEAFEEGEQANETKFAIDEARKAVNGEITGPGYKALAKHNPYTQLIIGLTPDEAKLQAANKKLLEGTKGLFGPKPTEREIFLLLNEMLPSMGKTKEANIAGLDFIEKVNDMKLARADIIRKITNGGSKYVDNLEEQVQSQMKPLYEALRDELKEAVEKYSPKEEKEKKPGSEGKKEGQIKVRDPNKKEWYMTQEQIDNAKKKDGVIFEPV